MEKATYGVPPYPSPPWGVGATLKLACGSVFSPKRVENLIPPVIVIVVAAVNSPLQGLHPLHTKNTTLTRPG
jgi:hypothetical protein